MAARLSADAVKRYRHNRSFDELYRRGPLIRVTLGLPEVAANLRHQQPLVEITALIDTGASDTSVSARVAQALQLKATDRIKAFGASGEYLANVYTVNFTFTGSGIDLEDWQVTEFDNSGFDFDMLIGRDVLGHALLVYDGATGQIGLEIPSHHHPLNSPPWSGSPIIRGLSSQGNVNAGALKRKHRRKMERQSRKKNRKHK